jgi:predicted ArsR family transcriptional regulator
VRPVKPLPIRGQGRGDRTRARILAALAEGELTVAALARRLGLHAHGLRRHLELLMAAGLVGRQRRLIGWGPPKNVYRLLPH